MDLTESPKNNSQKPVTKVSQGEVEAEDFINTNNINSDKQ